MDNNRQTFHSLFIVVLGFIVGCTTQIDDQPSASRLLYGDNNPPDNEEIRPAPESQVLTPGSGWSGPTSEPPRIGSGRGSDAKAIARWDVVPHQAFSGLFNVGVIAFHMNSIDRVEFAVEGGRGFHSRQ